MVLLPLLLERAVAAVTGGRPVGRWALAMAGVALGAAAIRIASRTLIFNAARDVEYDLRRDLFDRLLALPPSYFRRHPTGDVMSRLTNDLTAVRAMLGAGTLNFVNTALAYGLALTRLLSLSPRLTLIALLPYPLLLASAQLAGRRIFRWSRAVQDRLGELTSTVQEDLAGIQVVKGYAIEPARERAFARRNRGYLDDSLALVRARSAMMPALAMGGGLASLIVLWVGGRATIAGTLPLPELVEFNALLGLLAWPTLALGFILAVVQRGRASWSRLAELLAERPTIADAPSVRAPAEAIAGRIELRALTVTVDGRALVSGIDLAVPPGAQVALVGRTGGGKSTVAEALPHLLEIERGQVFLDGHDLCDLPLATVRGAIAYAPQEPFLFSTTIARNIAMGLAEDAAAQDPAADPRVVAAAEAAGLARDLAALPDGLRTVIGERGITLSGGQRQRVALGRALAGDPTVLVLDDSLSSVDAETERDILGHLRRLRAGRTTILISHRVAAVRDADLIVVLERGRIAERGGHAELLARGGIYADLYRKQLLADEIAAVEVAS